MNRHLCFSALILVGTFPSGSSGPWAAPAPKAEEPRLWSYVQVRLTAPENAGNYVGLRRAKVMVEGKPRPNFNYYLQMIYKDGNKSNTDAHPYIQEAWVRFLEGRGWVQVGQFKPPFGLERFTFDGALDSIDRSKATDHLIPNGQLGESFARDLGVQWEATTPDKRLWYGIGLFAGNGANNGFRGNGPLVAARVVRTARNDKLPDGQKVLVKYGGAFSTRRDRDQNFASALPSTKPLGYEHFSGHDTRWNLELLADVGPYRWRSEYFSARFSSNRAAVPTLSARGFYLQGAYQPVPEWSVALKYEGFDPNADVSDKNDLRWTTLNWSYYFHGNDEKVQVNYIWKHERTGGSNNDAWVVQYQRVF
jgi:hypothetical protein